MTPFTVNEWKPPFARIAIRQGFGVIEGLHASNVYKQSLSNIQKTPTYIHLKSTLTVVHSLRAKQIRYLKCVETEDAEQ
ncbi:hypothetical protein PSCICL_01870 [Pseudomonas cichorii]|nr:hypothetical protein PSCICG_03350 [Pseudomonas cichorii]GFM69195.1 hypothetical protein PSCICL_01870 [Pseudomonas cichorii]